MTNDSTTKTIHMYLIPVWIPRKRGRFGVTVSVCVSDDSASFIHLLHRV